ncbi:hypothetical protein GE061_018497 [Apolygus lucorum]|uniref:Uncharacterized protein n=1 Tax=Apolygus lucorum TaxID=248454 RepID=A0A8S9XGT0_APOLU|nr:hypothetical protein GE061_018497 [Apolygus lucorum]
MNRISIGGIADTEEFVIGFGLLHYSARKYPKSFLCEYHDMTEHHYWHWLNELNRANGWKHKSNFIAWYEYKYGGPKSLIGDLELFSEYMYDEYGVRIPPTRAKLKALAQAFGEEKKMKVLNEAVTLSRRHIRRVSVVYEGHPGVGLLCREILSHKNVNGPDGIKLTIFNIVPFMEKFTVNLHDDLVALPTFGMGNRTVRIAKNLAHAVGDCDLLIFMGNDSKTKESGELADNLDETELRSLSIFWTRMGTLAHQCAQNPDMRVVFTCMKYPCFNATFFVHAAPSISYDLVAAVTNDIALHALVYLSRASGIPMSHILPRTAYLWGSPGISHLADLGNTDAIYNRPNVETVVKKTKELKDEIIWHKGNPFDNMELEDNFTWVKLDPVDSMLENTWKYVSHEKERITDGSGREPYIASIRATMEILSHWYADEVPTIPLSVGICSNGGHGVPKGLVFSVPALVKDDKRRGWYDFHWCHKCRVLWNLDARPRWIETPCKRPFCARNPTTAQICNHFRNPDIFLPADPFLTLDGMINTILTVFYDLDGTGETLSKLLGPEEMKKFMNKSGKVGIEELKPQRPLIDDYAAKIRKELNQLREEWIKFVGKNSYLVYRPDNPRLRKLNPKKKKMEKMLKKKKQLEKLQKAGEEKEEEEEEERSRKDYETTGEELEQEVEIEASLDESVDEPVGTLSKTLKPVTEEEIGGESRVYKLKRRMKEEQEMDERARKVIDAITEEDIPILRLYPNAPKKEKAYSGAEWMDDEVLLKKAEQHFDHLGEERPATKFLREYLAKRMATAERFCQETVPKEFGHLYCTHTKDEHDVMKEDFLKRLPLILRHIDILAVWVLTYHKKNPIDLSTEEAHIFYAAPTSLGKSWKDPKYGK